MNVTIRGTTTRLRQRIQVQGIVQGVGFRPFVYRLAAKLKLAGFVRNDGNGVTIEAEGDPAALATFLEALSTQAPLLARVDAVQFENVSPCCETSFTIIQNQPTAVRQTLIPPDAATCPDCQRELLDPHDHRYHYPFINCTNCGPRFTIIQDIPYNRDKTTMHVFPLCPACQAEYEDPLNRRFHARPNACPDCGPTLELFETGATHPAFHGEDALHRAGDLLMQGYIVAIKGLGGYHLTCDALNGTAVSTLRQRKHRETKPFALMVPDLKAARQLCFINEAEAELLQSHRRPIVLLRRRPNSPITPDVAPHHNSLGVMLPYTPLHHLLFEKMSRGTEEPGSGGETRPPALVMTSGNISKEPIAYRDSKAQEQLASMVDAFLGHNRAIHIRCDDSIARIVDGHQQILRRSRGYVPEPIHRQRPFPVPILAVGGHRKNTFCLGKGHHAFVSHHIGDLENPETRQSFEEGIAHFMTLFDIQPEAIAHDLHPEYFSTKWVRGWPLITRYAPIAIQHHHAHVASVLAEHGLDELVIGVAADGTGYGTDGAVWGGEFMVADLAGFERVAHLAYVPLPGGEQAIRQPWRMTAVYLQQTFGDDFLDLDVPFVQTLDSQCWQSLAQMIKRDLNCPPTSSLGRLFDAVSALLTGRREALYEGQAATELEMMATPTEQAYPFAVTAGAPLQLDVRPTIQAIVEDVRQGTAVSHIAGRFHYTVALMITAVCLKVRAQTGLHRVALSGGVFQNRLLLEQLLPLLADADFQTFTNRQVPPNDGGLSLGQAAIAAAQISQTATW